MPENHEHSKYIAVESHYEGHRRDINDLDLEAYIDARIAAAGGGGSGYLSATVELNDEQIKALPSTPIDIIAAPGANKIVLPIKYTLDLDTTLDVYGNIHANGYWFLETDVGYYGTLIANRAAETLTKLTDLLTYNFTGFVFGSIEQGTNSTNYETRIPVTLDRTSLTNKAVRLKGNNSGSGAYTGGNAANTLKVTVYYVVVDL